MKFSYNAVVFKNSGPPTSEDWRKKTPVCFFPPVKSATTDFKAHKDQGSNDLAKYRTAWTRWMINQNDQVLQMNLTKMIFCKTLTLLTIESSVMIQSLHNFTIAIALVFIGLIQSSKEVLVSLACFNHLGGGWATQLRNTVREMGNRPKFQGKHSKKRLS